jgi:antitoxin (DNA-binding transcriptional repressor) of toxin-antitoxin stability system
MLTVNIHEAKTQLSKLVDRAAKGDSFIIAKAGRPLVKVGALGAPAKPRRLGFLAGEISVPKDFDTMGEAAIAALFGSEK